MLDVEETTHPVDGAGERAVPVLTVRGELDTTTTDRLREAVAGSVALASPQADGDLAPEDRTVLVLDLDGVSFCDSHGLSALLTSIQHAARRGVSLQVATGDASYVRRLVGRVGLEETLETHATVGAAAVSRHPGPLEREVGGT